MTDTQKLALLMICDPDHSGRTWDWVVDNQCLDISEDVDGEDFVSSQRALWVKANLAHFVLAGDDADLLEFIEQVDPLGIVRAHLTAPME